jgi:peptide/nickel transport system substrate-binding protein
MREWLGRNRRVLLGGVLVLALAATGMGGPVQAGPRAGSTIVVGMEAEPPNLDPQQYSGVHSMRVIRRMFEGLTRQKEESTQVEPGLAESWTISPDGLTYTFKLRRGIKFHDGTTFDANAVKFTFDRVLNQDHPANKWGKWSFVVGNTAMISSVAVVDPATVRFTLKYPHTPFLVRLADVSTTIVSPKAVMDKREGFASSPAGTGPYRFESWDRGNSIILRRNEDYWGTKGRSDRLIYRFIIEARARVTELLTGNVDLIVAVQPDAVAQIAANPRTAIHRQTGLHFWYLGLNVDKGALGDRRVRQAIAYALDKEAIVRDILKGTAVVAHGPVNPGTWAYEPNIRKYPHDLAKAKALLSEAGYPKGVDVRFWVPESGSGMQIPVDMGTIIQAQLARAGIRANITIIEWAAFLARLRTGEHEMFANSWLAGTDEPDLIFSFLLHSSMIPFPNRAHYRNRELDKLIEEARSTLDQRRRVELYRKAQRIVTEDVPYVFVDHDIQIVAAKRSVKGLKLHPSYDLRVDAAYHE